MPGMPMGAAPVNNVLRMVHGDLSTAPSAGLLVSSNARPFPFRHGRP